MTPVPDRELAHRLLQRALMTTGGIRPRVPLTELHHKHLMGGVAPANAKMCGAQAQVVRPPYDERAEPHPTIEEALSSLLLIRNNLRDIGVHIQQHNASCNILPADDHTCS